MPKFDRIVIIYNPKSTGDSEKLARDFAVTAKKTFSDASIRLVATEFAKHAEEIAAKATDKKGKTLLVSSSGDGGYNEVVNGLMAAKRPLQNITAAVLPAGNANDHSRTMHARPLTENLSEANTTRIDLLKVTIVQGGAKTVRYAHSYAGLGFTPEVALEINKNNYNPFQEALVVFKTFRKFKPFKILHKRKVRAYDNLVFSNINQMAKVMTLGYKNRPRDGRFEVVMVRHRGKMWLLYKMLTAIITWAKPQKRVRRYAFKTMQAMPMQMDGEVIKLQKDAKVTVTSAPRALKTLI